MNATATAARTATTLPEAIAKAQARPGRIVTMLDGTQVLTGEARNLQAGDTILFDALGEDRGPIGMDQEEDVVVYQTGVEVWTTYRAGGGVHQRLVTFDLDELVTRIRSEED